MSLRFCDAGALLLAVASLQVMRVITRLELALRFLSLAQRRSSSLRATSLANLTPQIVKWFQEDAGRDQLSKMDRSRELHVKDIASKSEKIEKKEVPK